VRTERFRLDHQGRLFDLVVDTGQRTPVEDSHPRVAVELREAIGRWRSEVLSELDGRTKSPFTIGHRSLAVTQLPARDATTTGGIKRSNRFPNCSYYTGWTNTADTIGWPVNVLVDADYEVEIYYTCASSDVGVLVELSGSGGSVAKRIDEAHDPPATGAEYDRFSRQESYVKDFKSTKMGNLRLHQGEDQLVLKSVEIPGEASIDFRLLTLRRIGP
jgi:hypothetical protein